MLKVNLSEEYIKAVTGSFDLETIFDLELTQRQITSLGSLPKCISLVYLDLSQNRITEIIGIDNLIELEFLDLSFNNISNIAPLGALLKLRNVGKYHIGLTGTIMLNSPIDCYIPLKFINKENSNLTNFKKCYCIYDQRFRYSVIGYKNANLLKEQIERNSLRRSKDLLNLPPKMIVKQTIEMNDSQAKLYEDIKTNVLEDIDRVNISTKSLLGKIVRLRQASTCPSMLTTKNVESSKIEYACELVDKICSDNEKVVIFSVLKRNLCF